MFQLDYQQQTVRETQLLTEDAKVDVASWSWVVFGLGIPFLLLGYTIGLTAEMLCSWEAIDIKPWGRVSGLALSLVPVIALISTNARTVTAIRRDAKAGLDAGKTMALEISQCKAVQLEIDPTVGPALAFQIDAGLVLLLWGPWLRDPEIYGVEESMAQKDERSVNGYTTPFHFPSTRFSLVCLPATNRVLSIEIKGQPLPVQGSHLVLEKKTRLPHCGLFRGTVDRLHATLTLDNLIPFTPESILASKTLPPKRTEAEQADGIDASSSSLYDMDSIDVDEGTKAAIKMKSDNFDRQEDKPAADPDPTNEATGQEKDDSSCYEAADIVKKAEDGEATHPKD